MIRRVSTASIVLIGAVSAVAPRLTASALLLLPFIGGPGNLSLLRTWGVVYLVVGTLVGLHYYRTRQFGPSQSVAVASAGALALFAAHLATFTTLETAVDAFAWSVAILIPFVVGTARKGRRPIVALGLFAVTVAVTMGTFDPVGFADLSPPIWRATWSCFGAVVFGLPLFALGWTARQRTD